MVSEADLKAIETLLKNLREQGRGEERRDSIIRKARVDLLNLGVLPGQTPFTVGGRRGARTRNPASRFSPAPSQLPGSLPEEVPEPPQSQPHSLQPGVRAGVHVGGVEVGAGGQPSQLHLSRSRSQTWSQALSPTLRSQMSRTTRTSCRGPPPRPGAPPSPP